MCRRPVSLSVELRIVRLIFFKHVVNGGEQHPGDGDNSFLVSPTLFESEIAITDFRESLCTNGTKRTLNKQGFDVGTSPADSGGFLLPGALIVLRRKPSPRAEVL